MNTSTGKVALVTGAGIGIGQGIARELGARGYRIVLQYAKSATGALDVAKELQVNGVQVSVVQADLTQIEACRQLVDGACELYGGIDLLVNNAGVTRAQPFLDTTDDLYAEMFNLNMRAYFVCAQQAAPSMIERGGGVIINISSIHGSAGYNDHVAYAATKGAVNAFTRTLAIEMAIHKIRVVCVAPGLIEVPRYFDRPGYTTAVGGTMVPWGRVGVPADIAKAVGFLASDDADFITGETIHVDGGTHARMGLA